MLPRIARRAFSSRVANFNAGPAGVPLPVLEKAKAELLNWEGCGMGVMEMSHRSKEYDSIHNKAISDLRDLLQVPDNYKIMFVQGGASTQFAATPLNMTIGAASSAHHVITGSWSKNAHKEADRLRPRVVTAASSAESKFTMIPDQSTWQVAADADYLSFCDNETVHGVEFPSVPKFDVPLVADMSSNFISRPVDISKYAVIYAGAQKNVGPAGITIVIARDDVIHEPSAGVPTMLSWKTMADSNSLYNTIPTFTVYMAGLVFQWVKDMGGIEAMEARSATKSNRLYDYIDNSGFYTNPVERSVRSRMNVPFLLPNDEKELTSKFIAEAAAEGMEGLKGHRSVGGCRASIYNSVSPEDVEKLVNFMEKFRVSAQ